jgi:hypothetical protein
MVLYCTTGFEDDHEVVDKGECSGSTLRFAGTYQFDLQDLKVSQAINQQKQEAC